ncbi:MAG: STAS domain-containing protein [Phycisphaerae bacterium]|jgi:anti-anti-sigma factor
MSVEFQTVRCHETAEVLIVEIVAAQLSALRAVERLEKELDRLHQTRSETRWVLDFAGVTFVVTQAINALMVTHKRLRSKHGDLVIVGLSDPIRRVFRLMKLDQVFRVAGSREEALEALSAQSK